MNMASKNWWLPGSLLAAALPLAFANAADAPHGAAPSLPAPGTGLFSPPLPGETGSIPDSHLMATAWDTDPDPQIKAFTTWVKTYLKAAPAQRLEMETEGEDLARARRGALKKLIATDPRRALTTTIPVVIRKQLPEGVVALLEKRIDAFGNWGTTCYTAIDPAQSREEKTAEIGGKTFKAFHYGPQNQARFVEGGSIHGLAIDDQLAVLNSPLRALEVGEAPRSKAIDFSEIDKNDLATTNTHSQPGGGDQHEDHPEGMEAGQGGTATGGGTFSRQGINVVPRGQGGGGRNSTAQDAEGGKASEPTPNDWKFYLIGGNKFGKATTQSQAERAADNIEARQNSFVNVSQHLVSDDGWVVSDQPQYLGDSGAPGSSGVPGRPPISHTSGTKRILVMRCQSPAYPLAADLLNNTYMTNKGIEFNTRYQYDSYGLLGVSFDYTPVYNLPSSFDNNNVDAKLDECKIRAQADGFNLNNYDVFLTVHGNVDVGWAGVQSGNKIFMKNNFVAWVFMHEFGHWLSLPHARLWQSTDGNPMSPSRTTVEYGDWMCYMGNGSNEYAYRTFSSAYLNRLRWVPDADVQTVTKNGTYTVYQYDNNVTGRVRSLKVPRDSQYTYWLSILGRAETAGVNHTNGVAIRAQNAFNGNDAYLVDMSSNTGPANAPLALNATWYDSAADVTFKVTEVGGTDPNRYAKVQVTFGPTHKAAYRPLVNGGIYRFSSRANANLSIAANANTADNQPIVMAASSDTDTRQQWVALRNSNGTYTFQRVGTSQVMDISNNAYANGTDIVQYTSNLSDAQRFYVSENADGYITLGHRNSEGNSTYALDLNMSNSDLAQWTYNGGNNQQWKPELVGLSTAKAYRLLPSNGQGQAVDIPAGNTTNGTNLILWNFSGANNQQWTYQTSSGGYYRFVSVHNTAKSLQANTTTAKVDIWDTNTNTNQEWSLARAGGHFVRILPRHNTTLSMNADGSANNSTISVQTNNGGSAQLWRFADVDG